MSRQRLSNIDTVMLRVDEPVQPNMGTGVMLLGAPLDIGWLKLTIEDRLLSLRRFRQRLVEPLVPCGQLYWEDDPEFDINYHLQQVTLPQPGDQAALQELVSLLASIPLELDRPLWQMHLVKSYGSGCALVCRVHHSLADGVALMHVLLALADDDPDARLSFMEPKPRQEASKPKRRPVTSLVRKGLDFLSDPPEFEKVASVGKEAAIAVQELLFSPPDSDTALRGEQDEVKRAAWSAAVSLDEIKTIGRRLDGTVNDVLLTAMTGALGRYLADRGDTLSDVDIHALVPISLRPQGTEDELGNQIGVIFLSLPVELTDPLDRLRELKKRMDEHKHSLGAPIVYAAMKTFGRAPSSIIKPAVGFLCARATVVVTNVKGPQKPLYLAGAPLEAFMFWIPRFGGIGVGVSIVSYDGEVRVGAISDKEIVSDPETLIAGFQSEFDALLALALEKGASVAELSAELDDALETVDEIAAA